MALGACSPRDGASGRSKLIGNYRLIVPADHANVRKDYAGGSLGLSGDGIFTQQCRYKNGRTDAVIGTWSYSSGRAQFSVFKDCAGVMGKRNSSASFIVEFASPPTIVLSSDAKVRYDWHGAQ
jgi:hypothetical protein